MEWKKAPLVCKPFGYRAKNYAIVGMLKVEELVSSSNAVRQSENSIRLGREPENSNIKCHEIDLFDRYRI